MNTGLCEKLTCVQKIRTDRQNENAWNNKHLETRLRPACICRTAFASQRQIRVKCMRMHGAFQDLMCHRACLLQPVIKCMRERRVTFTRISCIAIRCKRRVATRLTDGSVAQDGDLSRFRLRHLYLFSTASISTWKRRVRLVWTIKITWVWPGSEFQRRED